MAYVYDSSIIYDRGTRVIRHQLFALCQTSDFFTLIPTTEANKVFLKTYSLIHFLLGVVALVVGFVDKELIALFYLALLLLSSASFSILLAQKMKKRKIRFSFSRKKHYNKSRR